MALYFLVVWSIIRQIRVSAQCAAGTSYCLSGLQLSVPNDQIAAQYQYVGIDDNCEYFQHTQEDGIYLHYDPESDYWLIGNDINTQSYNAYCTQASLDQCTLGTWYVYDGTDTNYEYSVKIEQCSYDNTQCRAQYHIPNGTLSRNQHNENDFCIRRMWHRGIDQNTGLAGKYSVRGCFEEEPYYTADFESGFEGHDDAVTSIAWDNELSVWFIGHSHNIAAGAGVGAYCEYDNLETCSGNWYVYDGNALTRDSQVISGMCDTCTDTKYDEYCVYGGITRDQADFLVGIYTYDKCVELMHSYKHTTWDDWYFDDLYGNDTYSLTLHYRSDYNGFRINIDNNPNDTYATCQDIDDILDCSGNWSLYDPDDGDWGIETTIQSGTCNVIYDQCFDRVSDESEQYLCITEDDNDPMILDDSNGFYPYVAGQFKYLECDDEGFPVYVRQRDDEGNYINETWYNYTRITFNPVGNFFSVHNTTLFWMYCSALLVDICDTFWNFHDDAAQEWVHSPSIRLTKQKCTHFPKGAQPSLLDTLKDYWLYIAIGAAVLILCCVCCVCYLMCKKRKPKMHYYNDVEPHTPTTHPNAHQMVHSSSNQHRVSYASSNRQSASYNPKRSVSQKQTPKQSHAGAPPSYNTKYDAKPTPDYNADYETATAPQYDPKYDNNSVQNYEPNNGTYNGAELEQSLELEEIMPNNDMNAFNEGQAFGQVTHANSDVALDALMNGGLEDYNQGIAQWGHDEIIQWINGLGLSDQWRETALKEIRNGDYNGTDLVSVNSKQDLAQLFGIQNPMINSRLWKELKKMK